MPLQRKNYCPYVRAPFNECYLCEMDSQTIEKAIAYCAGDYEQCEIFRKNPPVNSCDLPQSDKR